MAHIKREWDVLTADRRAALIREVIVYFKTSHDQEVGMLAAEDILDFFLQAIGSDLYRKAIDDSKSVLKQNLENLDIDLDLLIHK